MNIEMIALNRLVTSAANVRKTGTHIGIKELAASIAAHGLLQNLQVRRGTKDKFEVVAGGRRLAALKLLVKQKAMAKDAEIPCHILDSEDAGEISLAENTLRLPMHPADQFTAFHALAQSGKGIEDIAARFGTSAAIVRQRLKLASVSTCLIEIYRDDEMSLDQLMAFCVSDDHDAQEAAWFGQPDWMRKPANIRRTLTAAHIDADDRRVRLIGIDRYQKAGGCIVRDLFEPDHEGYLTDPALLDRLVIERLEEEANKVRAEGWRWVEIIPQTDYATMNSFGRVHPEHLPLPADHQEEYDRLVAEYDMLIDENGDDPESDIVKQLDTLSEKIDALSETATAWRQDDLSVAGAIVSVSANGSIHVERGLIRADDRKAHAQQRKQSAASEHDEQSEQASPLSARLVENLTAERTAALRAVMQDNESVALAALAHSLTLAVFYPNNYRVESCLNIRFSSRNLESSAETIAESGAEILLALQKATWIKRLPEDAADLFGWLLAADSATVTSLIAFCASMSVDAVCGKQDRRESPHLVHADELANALKLDMAVWWEPTKERYLGHVSKALILEAVTETSGRSTADYLAPLKKAELINRAQTRLAGKGWLPTILRAPVASEGEAEPVQELAAA